MHDGQDVIPATRPAVRADEAEEQRVTQTIRRLRERFGGAVEPELLEARVRAFFTRFEGAQVREFVPILVEREVRKELASRCGPSARAR